MKHVLLSILSSFLRSEKAYAHCDVPCGIYDPRPAQIAAETVLKMTQLLLELDKPSLTLQEQNKVTRCILTKEEHARKCKEEILILWTDYFKPVHLEKFPQLHDTFWQAAKLCSTVKQEVSLDHAQALVTAVNAIATMFAESKR